jgi:hypothetical protein
MDAQPHTLRIKTKQSTKVRPARILGISFVTVGSMMVLKHVSETYTVSAIWMPLQGVRKPRSIAEVLIQSFAANLKFAGKCHFSLAIDSPSP